MIVETKPLEQRESSPIVSQGSFGENSPTAYTERREGGGGEGAIDHMWKVVAGADPDHEGAGDPAEGWLVSGGSLVVQGETFEIADIFIAAAAGQRFFVLSVTRDPDSRVADSETAPYIQAIPVGDIESTSELEHYILAELVPADEGDPTLRQHRFEEIISHELMIVENGEFKLLPFSTLTRNTYDPPEPAP
jgi:hypothetical protein